MPKHTISFNLPEESSELRLTQKAGDMMSVLEQYVNWLRSQIKHGTHTKAKHDALAECQSKLWELLNERNVDPFSD